MEAAGPNPKRSRLVFGLAPAAAAGCGRGTISQAVWQRLFRAVCPWIRRGLQHTPQDFIALLVVNLLFGVCHGSTQRDSILCVYRSDYRSQTLTLTSKLCDEILALYELAEQQTRR